MPAKVNFGRRSGWVLPMWAASLLSKVAPWPCLWLGCWTAKIAVTLDTKILTSLLSDLEGYESTAYGAAI